ncbi:MAG TPA: hypothetical protein VGK89_05395 [Candidatus Eisenbacteria bacterium]|jgi:hypothetical protein
MPAPRPDFAAAFAPLERRLLRRRLAAIEPRLRLEIVALGVLAMGYLFWQTRLALASLAFPNRPWAAAAGCAAGLAACALAGAALAGTRHAERLANGFPAPPWLALPVPAGRIHRHLAQDSCAVSRFALLPGLAVLAAGARIVPAGALAALAAGFVVVLDLAGRLGCAIAFGLALLRAPAHPGADPATRVLAVAARPARARRFAPPRWRAERPLAAFLRKDLLLARRPGPARLRLLAPLALGLLWLLPSVVPILPEVALALTYALTLVAAAGMAGWIVALVSADPFPVLRGLPVGVLVVWGARVLWAALGAVALGAGQALAGALAGGRAPHAYFSWTALVSLGIGVLGANYAVTLYPRAQHARRMLGLTLGMATGASLMIPFLGWSLLLAALLHSARRLPRWAWQEPS